MILRRGKSLKSLKEAEMSKVEGMTKVLYYTLDSIVDPEGWLESNQGKPGAEERYAIRCELRDQLFRDRTPSDPTCMSPMISTGYGAKIQRLSKSYVKVLDDAKKQIVYVGFITDENFWVLPVQTVISDTAVTLINGQTLDLNKKTDRISISDTSMSWSLVAAAEREKTRQRRQAQQTEAEAEVSAQ